MQKNLCLTRQCTIHLTDHSFIHSLTTASFQIPKLWEPLIWVQYFARHYPSISNIPMSILKYLNRVQRMHWLIKTSSTGCCDEFADKMGLSRRQLLENLNELKAMGAPIKFGTIKNSYYYEKEWSPFSILDSNALNNVRGGGFYEGCYITALQLNTIVHQSPARFTWD